MSYLFEFIIGDIISIRDDYIILQNNGIGYKIYTSTNSIIKLELGVKDVVIYTNLIVRDDGVFLYGFISEEEMDMFKLLQLVSKVGPKVALGILSTITPDQIKLAIIKRDIESLSKAPGIGKKTAERLILELKDRIDKDVNIGVDDVENIHPNEYNEAVNGLMSLGYTRIEVEKAIRNLDLSRMKIEDIIREGLKKLSK